MLSADIWSCKHLRILSSNMKLRKHTIHNLMKCFSFLRKNSRIIPQIFLEQDLWSSCPLRCSDNRVTREQAVSELHSTNKAVELAVVQISSVFYNIQVNALTIDQRNKGNKIIKDLNQRQEKKTRPKKERPYSRYSIKKTFEPQLPITNGPSGRDITRVFF